MSTSTGLIQHTNRSQWKQHLKSTKSIQHKIIYSYRYLFTKQDENFCNWYSTKFYANIFLAGSYHMYIKLLGIISLIFYATDYPVMKCYVLGRYWRKNTECNSSGVQAILFFFKAQTRVHTCVCILQ